MRRRTISLLAATIAASIPLLCAGAAGSSSAGPRPEVELSFEDFDGRSLTNLANGARLAVRHGEAVSGIQGRAVALSGHPDQCVDLGLLGFDQPATISLWIRRSSRPQAHPAGTSRPEYVQEQQRGQGRLLSRPTGSPSQGLAGSLRIGPEKLEVWHGRGWSTLIAASLPADTWLHLAVVYDERKHATGFLNGQRHATVASGFDGRALPQALVSASGDRHFGFPLAGALDEVRIYRRALSDLEVAALARPPEATTR
jgi:hypothetical protein